MKNELIALWKQFMRDREAERVKVESQYAAGLISFPNPTFYNFMEWLSKQNNE